MIKCICIDDQNRPKEIPQEKWIKKGELYHIIHILNHVKQNGMIGVQLYEKPLGESCSPYESFIISRFAIPQNLLPQLLELMKDCKDLDEVDVQDIFAEQLNTFVETTV